MAKIRIDDRGFKVAKRGKGGGFDVELKGIDNIRQYFEESLGNFARRAEVALAIEQAMIIAESSRRVTKVTGRLARSVKFGMGERGPRNNKRRVRVVYYDKRDVPYATKLHYKIWNKDLSRFHRQNGERLFLTNALKAVSHGIINRVAKAARANQVTARGASGVYYG